MPMQGQKPAQPQGAPFGQSPATQPTPNKGAEAAAMQMVAMAVNVLGQAMVKAGAASELGQGIMKHLAGLSKLVPPGASSPTTEKNTLEQAQLRNAQQNQMMQQMRGAGGAGGAPAQPQQAMPRAA